MLDRSQSIPLYEQLKNIIENKINNGELKAKDQLPSERELGEKYNISRITVRQAIALAEQEGLVKRVHGIGTFVVGPKIKQELQVVDTFQSTVEQQGLIASTKLIKSNTITSDFQLSRILNLEMMSKVFNMQLVGLGNDSPIVYYDTYFPYELGVTVNEFARKLMEENKPFSTLDLYKMTQNEYKPTHSEQTIEAIDANDFMADVLHINPNFSLLKITSIIYQGTIPLEYKEAFYRADKYKFFITRQINM